MNANAWKSGFGPQINANTRKSFSGVYLCQVELTHAFIQARLNYVVDGLFGDNERVRYQ